MQTPGSFHLITIKTFSMKKMIFYSLFIAFFMSACGQSPQIKLHVYSRVTLPGIRPDTDDDNHIFPKTYSIYAEVKKGTKLSVEGCWLDGKYYKASGVKKISSPVIVSEPSIIANQKDTLVKKTANDIYEILQGEEKSRMPVDAAEKKLASQNQFVLIIKVNGKLQFVSSAKIKELSPAAMM
jgi:hypothetical protein